MSTSTPPEVGAAGSWIDRAVFTVVAGLVVVAVAGIAWASHHQQTILARDLELVRGELLHEHPAMVLSYSAALIPYGSFALARNAAVFSSFLLVLVGSLFVLVRAQATFTATAGTASLSSTSPGLAIAAFGALLAWSSLQRGATVELVFPSAPPTPLAPPPRVDPLGRTQ